MVERTLHDWEAGQVGEHKSCYSVVDLEEDCHVPEALLTGTFH